MKKTTKILTLIIICIFVMSMFCACRIVIDVEDSANIQEVSIKDVDLKMTLNLCQVSRASEPKLKTSFKDENYYYYYFYLGSINNVPLEGFSNLTRFVNHGQKVKIGFESTEVQTSTISSAVTNTLQEQTSTGQEFNVKAGVEFGRQNSTGTTKSWKVYAEAGYKNFGNSTTTETYTETYSDASSFSKTKKTSVNMEFDESAANGYYGYILTGALNVYATVIYDVSAKIYYVDYFSDIKEYWTDFYYFTATDEFVNYEYETIEFNVPQNLPVPTMDYSFEEKTYTPIKKNLNIYNCADNGKYDKNEQAGQDDDKTRHNGYNLAELVLYGCKESGNYYTVGDKNKFSLKIHVLQDVTDLPRVGTSKTSLNSDSATRVKGTNINSTIGYGAYWVRVTYADDTQVQYNATNQFGNANSNTYIEILDSNKVDSNKNIAKIEVVLAYELYAGGPWFMTIWWSEYTNWRCEYEFNFIK